MLSPPTRRQISTELTIKSIKAVLMKTSTRKHLSFAIYTAFFLSGLAGLMHQVIWARLLVQLIGSTAHAQMIVLAVFMGGLAIGATWFGKLADQHRHPLRLYIILELVIGGYCLLVPWLLDLTELGYVGMARSFFDQSALTLLLRVSLVTLLILGPSVLMGATLPVMSRHLVHRLKDTQRQVANLYALNSLGAVVGVGLAGFVMLPLFGIHAALGVASLLNFIAAAVVIRAALYETHARLPKNSSVNHPPKPSYSTAQYVVTLFALVCTGFAAMSYEVLFNRIIALAFGASTYSFSIMLISFITGISIGSAIVARLNINRPLWLLGLSQLAVVAALLTATPLISRMPYLIDLLRIALQNTYYGFEIYQVGKGLLCLGVLLAPTIFLGFSFPLVTSIQVRNPQEIGARVGSTYAWNTLGNVMGVTITGLILLPTLGLLGAFHFSLALNLVGGIALLAVADESGYGRRIAAGATISLVILIYIQQGSDWSDAINLARNHLRLRTAPPPSTVASVSVTPPKAHPASSFEAWQQTYIARQQDHEEFFFTEDAHATVLVTGNADNRHLYVNTKPDASNTNDLDTQLLMAHAPLLLATDARKVLIIGYGSGITAGSALRHPIDQADIVEISPAVVRAGHLFEGDNYQVLQDTRAHTYIEDGQSFLRTAPNRYDIIISQPPNPWIAGVGGLFTVDYFQSARDRLTAHGLFAFWFHAYEQSDESVGLIIRTVAAIFPHVMLFADNDLGNLIAVASTSPIEPNFTKMEHRYQTPGVKQDLARLGISNLAGFLSHHRLSQSQFAALSGSGSVNTVEHQRLEYMAPRSFFQRDNSFLLEQYDPLIKGTPARNEILLDRYISYRAMTDEPMTRLELTAAARYTHKMGGYGPTVASAISARAANLE